MIENSLKSNFKQQTRISLINFNQIWANKRTADPPTVSDLLNLPFLFEKRLFVLRRRKDQKKICGWVEKINESIEEGKNNKGIWREQECCGSNFHQKFMLKSFVPVQQKEMITRECRMRGVEGNWRENLFDEFLSSFYTHFFRTRPLKFFRAFFSLFSCSVN